MNDPRWVWVGFPLPKRNAFARFRRLFRSRAGRRLSLSISADARYWLWINGRFLGSGPVRSWVNHWKQDDYDLTGLLRDGENVVAVLVNHMGHGTFQYLPAPPGLAVQVRGEDGALHFQTDPGWRCSRSRAYRSGVPRISLQQGFEEHFDARREDGWLLPGYRETGWTAARPVPPPHPALEPRGIPALAVEPILPRRVVRVERVRPASQTWTLDLRSFFLPDETSCRVHFVRGHLFTQIRAERAQEVEFLRPHHHVGEFKVNGIVVPALDGAESSATQAQRVRLRRGWNTVVIPYPHTPPPNDGRFPYRSHFGQFVLTVRSRHRLQWSATGEHVGSPWGVVGPFGFSQAEEAHIQADRDYPRLLVVPPRIPEATPDGFRTFYVSPPEAKEVTASPLFRPIPKRWICRDDVFAAAAGDEMTGSHSLTSEEGLLSTRGEWATVAPGKEGEDIRMLFDFGREIVGYQTFEVDARAGTVLDFHNFEFIQTDGRENWAEGMNNSFRYVCREGAQRYRTLMRRGFRYAYLICRNQRAPVRLRAVAAEFVAYPQARQGWFRCSDALLNKVWEVGAHTLRCCTEDTYTDCPSNEQAHWTGDARNEALIDWVVNGDPRLWHHCLVQTGQSLELPEFPITASQVPSAWPNIVPAWSFLWMRSCREYLLWTGDVAGARLLLPWLRRNVAGLASHIGRDGLFTMQAYNLFDWAAMDTPPTGTITHLNCFAALALDDVAQLAQWLGEDALASRLKTMAASLRRAVNRYLWDDRRQAYLDCLHAGGGRSRIFSQQTQTAALVSGTATGLRAARCRARITSPPADFVRAGSPFFGFFLLELLAKEGKERALLETVRKDWGFMVLQGATTFWEMWSLRAGGRLTRSHCHGWSAAPTFFLSTAVLGIEPTSPGFTTVRITPRLGDLDFAHGAMPTPHGVIEARFERRGRKIVSKISLPPGVSRDPGSPA